MKRQNKLTSQQQTDEQQQSIRQQTQAPATLEFATPEEMLRHDALHTLVPSEIAHRLAKSIDEKPATTSWWRRLFGGSKP